jgi:uncharacterized SAM-binding protein YcdF (DUF218 family)
MTDSIATAVPSRTRFLTWRIFGLGFVTLSILAAIIFLRVGRWLVTEDPLEKAAAIAVLSGRMPLRALEAAKLYEEGYAPEIWLTHTSEPGDTLAGMGIPFQGEDYYNKRILMEEGVPESAIRVLDPPILNTADEVNAIAAQLARQKDPTVIIVTSKPHTRRARLLWHRLARSRGRAIVRAVRGDRFDPSHWWRTTRDTEDVVHELMGLFNLWAGLPLRPAG